MCAISADELRDGIALAERWDLRVKLGAGIGRKHFQQASITWKSIATALTWR